jgi:mono/diheme cytochrome c family protein
MQFRQVLLGIIAVIILAVIGGYAWTWRPAIEPIASGQKASIDRKVISHGAELAAIGNCADCHTAKGGVPYAGGHPIPTPFGTIYGSNLTPDRETGIGTWPEEAFRRAMRDGVDREGRQLYPAFPYDHFTKATDGDIHALYSFLMSRSAVKNQIPANDLKFPFNYRPMVAGWKVLFLRQTDVEPDSTNSAEWNRGRYLVEGLGHCGGCHTPRNALGAEKKNSAYSGGVAEGWNAPALNSASVAAHRWTADQLTEYLSTGWHKLHGAASGPMSDVAKNLDQASSGDVRAIAVYVASLSQPPRNTSFTPSTPRDNVVKNTPPEIIAVYNGACANCHNDRGDVGPSKAVSLGLSTAVRQPDPANTVRVILQGIHAYRDDGGPYMPSFEDILTDRQIAAVAQYVRARYTDQPDWTDVRQAVAKAKQEGAKP